MVIKDNKIIIYIIKNRVDSGLIGLVVSGKPNH